MKEHLGRVVALAVAVFAAYANTALGDQSAPSLCQKDSAQPCWDYFLWQAARVDLNPAHSTLESFRYSNTFFGRDTSGPNPAFIADYTHVPGDSANTDLYDAGFALFGAPGDPRQISQQIGLEGLISGRHANPMRGVGSLENGYTLAAVYRIAIPWNRAPMELGLRFLHQRLTTQTSNGLEGEFVITPFDRLGFVASYRHDNTQFKMVTIGVRFDFPQ